MICPYISWCFIIFHDISCINWLTLHKSFGLFWWFELVFFYITNHHESSSPIFSRSRTAEAGATRRDRGWESARKNRNEETNLVESQRRNDMTSTNRPTKIWKKQRKQNEQVGTGKENMRGQHHGHKCSLSTPFKVSILFYSIVCLKP